MPKIKIKYIKDPNYSPVYSNGALGGVNVKREIVIHFYSETLELPKAQSFEIEGDKIKQELIKERNPNLEVGVMNVERNIKTGVIMSKEEAIQLHIWLGKQLEALKQKEGGEDASN